MKKKGGDGKKFEWEVVQEFDRTTSERGGSVLCVERWIVDGKRGPAKLARREVYMTEQGERSGKAQAFTLEDLRLIQERWDEIIGAMTGKPVARPQPASVENADNGIPAGEPF